VAALAFTASSPHSLLPLIGASGAIAGVLAVHLMFRPCHKVMVFIPYILLWFVLRPIARLDAFWVLGGWALIQLWHISVQSQDEVAYMAHVGGFAAGAISFRCCGIIRSACSSAFGRSLRQLDFDQRYSVRRSINVDMPMARPLASAHSF
jgi:membrane associated rhomboid family serine protease